MVAKSRRRTAAGDGSADVPPPVSPDIAAEAAVWVARLHGPARSRQMEQQCLEWQQRSASHREAFERCTDTWQDVSNVTLSSAYSGAEQAGAHLGPRPGAQRLAAALAVAGVLIAGAVGFQHWQEQGRYATDVGEQRLVVLDDGTRTFLNTDTRMKVELGPTRRTVNIERGEALFEAATDPRRPFVVRAAGSEVVALGTVFAVRLTSPGSGLPDSLVVTLFEGQVRLQPHEGGQGVAPSQAVTMQAGDRVRLSSVAGKVGRSVPRVDRPRLEPLMAWKRSEAVFDDTSLSDAVTEMNRYSRTPIVLLDDPALGNLHVSGIYRTGDNGAFASAVAALHGLRVQVRDGRLELDRAH